MRGCFVLTTATMLVVGCGLDEPSYKSSRPASSVMAITNAEAEANVLRTGTSLSLVTTPDLKLQANSLYNVVVTNLNTTKVIARAKLLSDMAGLIELSTVAHDIGEFDEVSEEDSLEVGVEDFTGGPKLAELVIPVTPHVVHFLGHGFSVEEVQPPHIYSADSSGKALNAFVVGGAPDPGEVAAPIYVAGKGLPSGITNVDVYLVRDRDVWQGQTIPTPGSPEYLAGPVIGTVDRGILRPVEIPWSPTGKDVGAYDILVDVDRNGKFDFSFSAKDGADGEGKVGVTIQYGAAWFRAKAAIEGKHLLVNLAYDSSSRSGGTWTNSYNRNSRIYSYVNPPVQKGERHAFVNKVVVYHQSWSGFWSNPEKYSGGMSIGIADITVQETGGTTQHSCTNSPPVAVINPAALPVTPGPQQFDIVFDYNGNGRYDLGVDLLDVIGHDTSGNLISAKALSELPDEQIYGFQVVQ